MKNLKGLLVTFILVTSTTLSAMVLPGGEYPTLGADMEILHAEGIYEDVNKVSVSLMRKHSNSKITSISMTYKMGSTYYGENRRYVVVNSYKDACGSFHYEGQSIDKYALSASSEFVAVEHSIEVVSHIGRTCEDYRMHSEWEVSVRDFNVFYGEEVGSMELAGKPELLFHIM